MRPFSAVIFFCLCLILLCLSAACSSSSDNGLSGDGDAENTETEAENLENEADTSDGDADAIEEAEDAESESEAGEGVETEDDAALLDTPNDPRGLQPYHTDDPYYKEVGALDGTTAGLPSADVLRFVETADGRLLALTAAGPAWFKEDDENWSPYVYKKEETEIPYMGLQVPGMGLVLAYESQLVIVEGEMAGKTLALGGTVTAMCARHNADAPGLLLGFSEGWLNLWAGEDTKIPSKLREGAAINDCVFSSDDSTIFAATADGLQVGSTHDSLTNLPFPESETAPIPTALAVFEDQLLIGSDSGLFIYQLGQDSATYTVEAWAEIIPYPDIRSIAVCGEDMIFYGTSYGAWYDRYVTEEERQRHFFGNRLWLPSNDVRDIACVGGRWFMATPEGVGRVREYQTTLAEVAAAYDQLTQERHVRMGFTPTNNYLPEAGNVENWVMHDDDNDGQWTEMYLASQAMRYAVTGENEALLNARQAMNSMLLLEEVTGISGFFARSIVPASECQAKIDSGSGEWHFSETLPEYCWKGDSSSDEFVGHFYGLPLYYDLAASEEEKTRIAATLARTLDHMIERGYCWRDTDGECTTHALFQPEYINHPLGGQLGDAGFNSVVILGAFRAGYYMTGEQRFLDAFNYLAVENGYAEYVRICHEINTRFLVNHDTNEMTLMGLLTLIRYEFDPYYIEIWREGLEQEWQSQRPEKDPEFNFTYCWAAEHDEQENSIDCDLDISIDTLQQLPLSLVQWGVDNLPRTDIERNPHDDRHDMPQNMWVLPWDERIAMRWAENPYALQQNGDGHSELSGTYWLLPYWMGRFLGMIGE